MIQFCLLQGKNLTLASSKEDVTVKIGQFDCTVFKLTNTEVTCRPSSSIDPAEHPVVVGIWKIYAYRKMLKNHQTKIIYLGNGSIF